MNMIEGKLDHAGFQAAVGTRISLQHLPPNAFGKDVILGIRPEHFKLDCNGLPANIVTVEPARSEPQVLVRLARKDVVSAFRQRITARSGEMPGIRPEISVIHLFDTDSGNSLLT